MLTPRIEILQSTEPAHWLRDRLAPWWRGSPGLTVGMLAPEGYDAYARVYHKAQIQAPDKSWRRVRWSELAQANNRSVHPEMTFREVSGLERNEHRWGLQKPFLSLDDVECSALMNVLRRFTTTPERCYFAVWHGYGGMFTKEHCEQLFGKSAASRLSKATVQITFRSPDHILFSGPLEAVMDFQGWMGDRWFGQAPDVWWPEDRAWCVASDIDVDVTCLAGSRGCIEAVLATPELEALPTQLSHVVRG